MGELTVMVEQGPQAILAAVVRGQAPDTLLARLQETLEAVHFRLAGAFAEFDGDTVPFEPARPLLADCLLTVTRTPEAKRGIRALAWTVPLFLLIAIPAGLIIRSNLRWNAAVTRLRAEPGIVLVSAERGGGRWQFAGLRDPLSADPSAVLAAAGADTSRITARWDRYHSFDPSLVLERARRMLLPPPGVTLSLSGDTLRGRGAGPVDWVAKAGSSTVLPAGVSFVDLGDVELNVADSLVSVVAGIEQARVQFAVGSSALDADAGEVLRSVTEQYRRLDGAMPAGYLVALDLTGRTDARGTDAANLNLSGSRSTVVRNALAARGIPLEAMRPAGIGTTSPLEARDAEERERINRSVSFRVTLRWRGTIARPAP